MKLFPTYLNKGSRGPAVVVLQLLLLAMNESDEVVPDGDYGEKTAQAVASFQEQEGMEGHDIDGNFGPKTRAAFLESTGINVDELEDHLFVGQTFVPSEDADTADASATVTT